MAKRIIRWRLSHLQELKRVAQEEGIVEHTQIRDVEFLDVYYNLEDFKKAVECLRAWKADMPDEAEGVHTVNGAEAIEVRASFG